MVLEGRTTLVYGGGGAVGGAVARAFGREGASVFVAGRTHSTVRRVADEIKVEGGIAYASAVDSLDGDAVERHVGDAVARTGRIDVSFCAIGLGGARGQPLANMDESAFLLPVTTAMRANFITATAAGRRMARQGSGVILAISAQVARRPYGNVGGFGVACAALEGLVRQLAVELGPSGVRVVCLRSGGSPDAPGVAAAWRSLAADAGISLEEWSAQIADRTMLKRLPLLAEVANAAVLVASDRASGITAEIINLTGGELAD
jgi:NAD(P)-dependent dehydrogenase (short-subunit alcohol dehydrogenase family)